MKNTLIDVHNILMASLERLDDDEIFENQEKAKLELNRAKAIAQTASVTVGNASLMLQAKKHKEEYGFDSIEATAADSILLIKENKKE